MLKPIVFLDFDGVLNTSATWTGRGVDAVDADKVARLNTLVEEFDADIVVASSWRRHYSLETLRGFLAKRGLTKPERVIDTTSKGGINEWAKERGFYIALWLEQHGQDRAFVILDDMWTKDMFNGLEAEHVQTDPSNGFTDADLDKAREVLRKGLDT